MCGEEIGSKQHKRGPTAKSRGAVRAERERGHRTSSLAAFEAFLVVIWRPTREKVVLVTFLDVVVFWAKMAAMVMVPFSFLLVITKVAETLAYVTPLSAVRDGWWGAGRAQDATFPKCSRKRSSQGSLDDLVD